MGLYKVLLLLRFLFLVLLPPSLSIPLMKTREVILSSTLSIVKLFGTLRVPWFFLIWVFHVKTWCTLFSIAFVNY